MCPCEQEPHSRALLLEHLSSWALRVLRRVLLFLKLGQDNLERSVSTESSSSGGDQWAHQDRCEVCRQQLGSWIWESFSCHTVVSDASFSSDNNCSVPAGPGLFPAGPLVLEADGATCLSHCQRAVKGILREEPPNQDIFLLGQPSLVSPCPEASVSLVIVFFLCKSHWAQAEAYQDVLDFLILFCCSSCGGLICVRSVSVSAL